MTYLYLFYEFFKTGLFSIGGGLATLPFLMDIAYNPKYAWLTMSDLADMIAISESTPGPIGINTATYVGFTVKGLPGAIVATLGLVAPSIIIILIIAYFLKAFRDSRLVDAAFYGLRPASTGLIAAAGIPVLITSLLTVDSLYALLSGGMTAGMIKWPAVALAVVIYVLTNFVKKTKGLHPILFIAFAAVVGIVFRLGGV